MYKFIYEESKPSVYEGWMTKCKIGLFERWQRRYFRLQDRTLYYFKKEQGEPPVGFIPLINITVQDLPAKKGRKFGFQINLHKTEKLGVKRDEYLIKADSLEGREQWKAKIAENMCTIIVGAPYEEACKVSPKGVNNNQLMPYFFDSAFHVLNSSGCKLRGIWTIDVARDNIKKFMFDMDLNHDIVMDDLHNLAGAVLNYLKELPHSLISPEAFNKLKSANDVTVENMREIILNCPAPQREALKTICSHFHLVLENNSKNGVSQFSLISFLGPIIIREGDFNDKQYRVIQEKVAQLLINETEPIFEDIHQLSNIREQNIIFRSRINNLPTDYVLNESILDAPNGLIVNVVRKDSLGWCSAYTSNQRIGLIHESYLVQLTDDECEANNDVNDSNQNIGNLVDTIREKYPHLMLLFESMIDESTKLTALMGH